MKMLTAQEMVSLRVRYEAGEGVRPLARAFGIGRDRVERFASKGQWFRSPKRAPEVLAVERLYQKNLSAEEIAARLGIECEAVQRTISRNGLVRKQRPKAEIEDGNIPGVDPMIAHMEALGFKRHVKTEPQSDGYFRRIPVPLTRSISGSPLA